MSRLPTLSTPGRPSISTPPQSGIPTPTTRRPRSSLGPSSSALLNAGNEEMDQALQELLKKRPPSSLKNKLDDNADPDTPTHAPSTSTAAMRASVGAHSGVGVAPRTPGFRPKTPSGLSTPGASRAVSRSSAASRPSVTGTNTFTPRRVSMASSTTSTTPYAKRPESRASMAGAIEEKFSPVVGDKVRMQSMGMEGTLRYVGETEFKAGVWAGVELEGGFAGKGKNDGSVNGVPYFSCPPNCGVFVVYANLKPPTAGISRPASVASSHRSLASSQASYSLSGRMTPSGRTRPTATTPGRVTRTASSAVRPSIAEDDGKPVKTLLGTSTSSNALASGTITAGSRASKYLGMTAKQLDNARAGTLNVSVRNLRESTTTTPKASRVSMSGVTPVRPRQSVGGGFATPRARGPRASHAADMMPPPPSPGNIGRTLSAHQSQLEAEIRELKKRNAELEEELRSMPADISGQGEEERRRIDALQAEVDRITEEAETLRAQLSTSQADAADAAKLAEELQSGSAGVQEQLDAKNRELANLEREMKIAAERAQSELDAGMEAKRDEVRMMLERAEIAESEGAEMRALVEELTQAGQATISLYETKQYDLEDKVRTLEEKSRSLEEKLAKAREEQANAPLSSREATTAAEIDNETLTAQVKHLQQRLNNLEEELEETRAQADADAESWKSRLTKAKDAERAVLDREREAKEEIRRLQKSAESAKSRISELEGALKENNSALEAARAEIEGLRGEAAEASSMRAALQDAVAKEKALAEKTEEVEQLSRRAHDLETKVAALQIFESDKTVLEGKNVELETKLATLETDFNALKSAAQTLPRPASQDSLGSASKKGRLSSGSSDDESKRLRGFQHIISELSAENAELKEKHESVLEEIVLLKEEIKLLEETNELGGKAEGSSELIEAKATIQTHAQTIQDLNREVSELESLIESKIYREDELETRLNELEKELARSRTAAANGHGQDAFSLKTAGSSHSRQASTATNGSAATEGRLFAGKMDGDEDKPSPLASKLRRGKWCADCETNEHDTADCPMAEEVF